MLHAAGIVFFLMCAALQYNDPDPHVWVPLYLFPAGVNALAASSRRPRLLRLLAWGGAAAYAVGALWVWPGLDAQGPAMRPDLGGPWINVEEVRESLGLGIAAIWMAALARAARTSGAGIPAPSGARRP
jgi:hypothetical protein